MRTRGPLGCKATVEFYLFGELVSRDVGFHEFSFTKEAPGVMTSRIYDTSYEGRRDGRHEAGYADAWDHSSGTRSTRRTARLRSSLHRNRRRLRHGCPQQTTPTPASLTNLPVKAGASALAEAR